MKYYCGLSEKKWLCFKKTVGFIALALLSGGAFASSVLSVKPVHSLELAEQQALEQTHEAQEKTNRFRWWLAPQELKSLQSLGVKSLAGFSLALVQEEVRYDKNCYVLMADTSGSMKKYWPDAKRAIGAWMDAIPASNPLFGFAESVYNVVPMLSGLPKEAIKTKLDEVVLNGKDTQLYLAVNEALEITKTCATSRRHLVVFSDGDAEDKAYSLAEVVSLAKQQQVSVHTIGFGDLSKSKTALKLQVLKTLSDKTNGHYQHFSEIEAFKTGLNQALSQHQLAGVFSLDAGALAYGETSLMMTLKVVNSAGDVEVLSQAIRVTDTEKFKNVLVLISQKFGGKNPWLIIGGFVLLLLLLLALWLWLKAKKKRKVLNNQAKDALKSAEQKAEQAQQNQAMQEALERVNEKMDVFQPEAPVNEKGTAYGWLKDGNGRCYDLINYSSTIGRSAESDVVIEDLHISSQHAILDFKKGRFIWTDRAPLNQTYINEHPLSGSAEIKPGDKIRCGQTLLEFVLA